MGSNYVAFGYIVGTVLTIIIANVVQQLLFRKKNEPPVVFHWIPFIGSAVPYGTNPHHFLKSNREKVSSYHFPSLSLSTFRTSG